MLSITGCHYQNKTTFITTATTQAQESTISAEQMQQATEKLKQVLANELSKNYILFSIVVDLQSTITLDQSWGSSEMFKKSQEIHFFGKGSYDTGVKNISSDYFKIDPINRQITLTLKNPVPSLVEIDEQNTTTTPANTGLLRFGDIKLTANERQKLTQKMIDQMDQIMTDENLYRQRLPEFTKEVEQTVQKTLQNSSFKEYRLSITFE